MHASIYRRFFAVALLLLVAPGVAATASAATAANAPAHKVVIQVSTADTQAHRLAVANAVNLQKHYGADNVAIEIVAYGPGLQALTPKSDQTERIQALSENNVKFSACRNTMRNIARTTGAEPELTPGVQIVPAGVARIIELQEQGYTYVRP